MTYISTMSENASTVVSTPGPSGIASRKRAREADEPCCIGGCGNPQCSAKKNATVAAAEADGSPQHDGRIRWWYVKLDSETENYDSDTPDSLKYESTWSVQDDDTDVLQDSDSEWSDDENRWRSTHRVEFEIGSDNSPEEGPFGGRDSSSAGSSDFEAVAVVAATVTSEAFCAVEYYADSSSDLSDPELEPQDKWSCLKCKRKNQPIPRYCQQCFSVRKKWFPPRPRHRGRVRKLAEKEKEQADQRRKPSSTSLILPKPDVTETPTLTTQSMCQPSTSSSFQFTPPSPSKNVPTTSTVTSENNSKPECSDNSLQREIEEHLRAVKQYEASLSCREEVKSINRDSGIYGTENHGTDNNDNKLGDVDFYEQPPSVASTVILDSSLLEDDIVEGSQIESIGSEKQSNMETNKTSVISNNKSSFTTKLPDRMSSVDADVVDFGVLNEDFRPVQFDKDVDFRSVVQVDEDVVDFRPIQVDEDVVDFGPVQIHETSSGTTNVGHSKGEDLIDCVIVKKTEIKNNNDYKDADKSTIVGQSDSQDQNSNNSSDELKHHQSSRDIDSQTNNTPSSSSPVNSQSPSLQSFSQEVRLCIICETNEANTAFTHNKIAHMCVCYPCAKKVYNSKGQCPICRRAASSFFRVIPI